MKKDASREKVLNLYTKAELLMNKQYSLNNLDKVVDIIMNQLYVAGTKKPKMREFIFYIIKDILDNENVNPSKIEWNLEGGHSIAIFIGSKVVKIGNSRKTIKFPNNPYIIKPLLRQNVTIDNDKIFVEVTEQVQVNEQEVTQEVLYDLYKKLRDLGLVWTDISPSNVGRLLKDNKIYWREDINPSDETLNMSKYRGAEQLKKGDYVVLDADYIFAEDDPNIEYVSSSLNTLKEFEKRYNEEIKSEKTSRGIR